MKRRPERGDTRFPRLGGQLEIAGDRRVLGERGDGVGKFRGTVAVDGKAREALLEEITVEPRGEPVGDIGGSRVPCDVTLKVGL